jgi:2-methylcitrate dehydratase PrpD
MLAQAGVLGPTDVLENPKGFLHAFSPQPEPEVLTSKLGEEWRSSRMIVKLAPAHAFAQVFISALNNARDAGLTWDPNCRTDLGGFGPSADQSLTCQHRTKFAA